MKPKTLPLCGLACAILLSVVVVALPLAGACVSPAGVFIQGWLSSTVRWLYWPMLLVLAFGSLLLWRFSECRLAGGRLAILSPLSWLPVLVVLPYGLASIDHTLAGLVLPFGGAFLAAVCVDRAFRQELNAPSVSAPHPMRNAWIWFVVTALLLLAFYFGVARPQHFASGDVRHYSVQVDNLLERGDLDLAERMTARMNALGVPDNPVVRDGWLIHAHMRTNAAGQVYSYHSFGFPLLVWPFRAILGRWGDGVLMALLGALALCGVRAACLAHGAPRTAANAVSLLTGLSFVWVYTAMSFLPEMLGFALVAWAFWAVAAQEHPDRRWLATVVAAVACAYLPVAHIRFTPTAGLLAVSFGLEGLFGRNEPFWRRKAPRLATFSLFCFVVWGALWLAQLSMFRGTATYDYSDIAGRMPLVMWAMFADRRGVVSVAPAVFVCIAGTVVALFRGGAAARRAAMAAAVVVSTLYFCCCTTAALIGACLNGRYFYVVLPVLLPFFALALARADRVGRLWMLFLALPPVLYLFFVAPFLRGARLVYAPAPLRGFLNFSLTWEPFPSFFGGSPKEALVAGSVFSAALFAVSLLACARKSGRTRLVSMAALLATAFFSGRYVDRVAPPTRVDENEVLMGKNHFHDFRILEGTADDFFQAFRPSEIPDEAVYVLTDDESHSHDGIHRMQFTTELPEGDWLGRPLRWGKVLLGMVPLRGARGFVACRATGRVIRGTGHLALQIGGVADAPEAELREGPFDVTFHVRVYRGNGGVNFLLSLDGGVGEIVVDTTEIAPCPEGLLRALGGFPEGTRVVEKLER